MFPIRARRKLEITPYFTFGIIAVNVLVFLWETANAAQLGSIFLNYALIPCDVAAHPFSFETLIDSVRTMFLHGSWLHVIGNMLFLLVFGPHLEQFFGRVWYLGAYFLAGFAANFAHVLVNIGQCAMPFSMGNVPVVGASGAVFGMLGAFLLLYPATRIQMLMFFRRMPVGLFDMRAFWMIVPMFALDLIDGIGQLGNTAVTSGVAVWAHVGGFLMGVVFAFLFTAFVKPLPRFDLNDEFEG